MFSPSFPVLRLPTKALRATLQNFAIIDLLSFSLISPNSVRPLNIQAANVSVDLDDTQSITVFAAGTSSTFFLKPYSNQNWIFESRCRWLNQSLSIEKILKNFLVALNLREVNQLLVSRNHEACDKLAGIKWRTIIMLGKTRPLFDHIYREAKGVSLSDRGILNKHTRAIFSENLNRIRLNFSFVMDFNDLLAMNATKAEVHFPFSLSNVNLFLRHFINGLNPRLREIWIELKRENLEDYKETLLNGIKFWTSSFSKTYDDGRSIDGLEFRRNDGVEVIIFVDPIRHSFELTC